MVFGQYRPHGHGLEISFDLLVCLSELLFWRIAGKGITISSVTLGTLKSIKTLADLLLVGVFPNSFFAGRPMLES
jgi:hypothetical protein